MIQVVCVCVPMVVLMLVVNYVGESATLKKHLNKMVWVIFACYFVGYLYVTVFSRKVGTESYIELTPFHTYRKLFKPFIKAPRYPMGLFEGFVYNTHPVVGVVLNILLYSPLGYLLPILFPKLKPKHVILIGCLCSIATEATQYLLKMGWCETDDVIHNTLGTAIGMWVWLWQSKRLTAQKSANSRNGEP